MVTVNSKKTIRLDWQKKKNLRTCITLVIAILRLQRAAQGINVNMAV